MTLKIGDNLWYLVLNGVKDDWQPRTILGETKQSWIVGPQWDNTKVSKRDIAAGELRSWKASRQEVDDCVWLAENRYKITQEVQYCGDPSIFRTIAQLIGYEGSNG